MKYTILLLLFRSITTDKTDFLHTTFIVTRILGLCNTYVMCMHKVIIIINNIFECESCSSPADMKVLKLIGYIMTEVSITQVLKITVMHVHPLLKTNTFSVTYIYR